MARLEFASDYMEGCIPEILTRLTETNLEKSSGYGSDEHTARAAELIREACDAPDAEVHLLAGGTQTNRTVIGAMLKPWEGVIAAQTGHISVQASGTSRSSPPAATTGTSTRPNRAAARSSSAWRAAAGTMKTERTRSRSILATSSPFPQASSTGTAPQGTAGSRTSPSRCPASARATNGSSPSTRPSTTRLRDFPDEASARTRVRAG